LADLVLRLDGYDIEGWTAISVSRSLDQLADTFDLALTTELSSRPAPVPISEGQACMILYGEDVLLSGYIDTVDLSYDSTSTSLSVSGRSKAGDLVDCTALGPGSRTGGSWRDTTFLAIANDICGPFRITCYCDLGDPLENYFKLTEGETCFSALERLGKDYGLRVVSYPDGDIQYTRTGLEVLADVVIENGRNVLAGGVTRDLTERYSDYLFKGQLAASDETSGGNVNTSHLVQDEGVGRYRPLLIETDEQVRNSKGQFTKGKNKSPLQLRAEWERNTRAGRSRQLSYEVCDPSDLSLSWEMRPGELWHPNVIVTVLDPFLEIDGQYLVTSVTLTRDSSGTRTSLTLTHPEAYETELPPKKKAKKGFSW
jgi:prophage tail gpP-like protein